MIEYISREAALLELEKVDVCNVDYPLDVKRDAIYRLKAINAADVQPVVRGEWVRINGLIACSVCKENPTRTYHNFCPNCGARMDGEEESEQCAGPR